MDPSETTCIVSGDSKNVEAVDTYDFAKSQSLSLVGAVSSSRRRSQSIVHKIFFGALHSGITIGPFSSEVSLLNQACAFHGLELKKSHELQERHKLLLQHLLHGKCMSLDTYSTHYDYTACRKVAAGFSLSSDLVDYILDNLTLDNTLALSGSGLWTIAHSICGDLVCSPGQEDHHRRKAISISNIFCNRGIYEDMSKSLQSLFTKAEYMSKPCLEAVVCWHGLCFVGTKDQLLDRIIDHILKGMCASHVQNHRVACFHVTDGSCTQPNNSTETDVFDSRTELQIQLLNSVHRNIGKKPLLCVLKCCTIPYDAAATLCQLRKSL